MKKIILILLLMILNLGFVFAIKAEPLLYLAAQDSGTNVSLAATAYDRYDNAGIEYVKIYEERGITDRLVGEKTCNYVNPCVFSMSEAYPISGSAIYYAETKDKDGNVVFSANVPLNLAPILTNIVLTPDTDSTDRTVTWNTNENAVGAVKYGIVSGTYTSTANTDTNADPLLNSITLTGLSEGVTYYYVVESVDLQVLKATSAEGSFTAHNPLVPIISNVNSNVNTAVTPVQVIVTWNTDIDATGTVRYGTVSGSYPSTANTDTNSDPRINSITLNGLNDDATYYYIVESNNLGNIGKSAEGSFTIPDLTAPVMTNIQETDLTLTSVRIQWNTNELADSKVLYGTASGTYTITKQDLTDTLDHNILVDNLVDGVTYYYVIESTDIDGNTGRSAERSFTTGRILVDFIEPDDEDEFYVGDTIEGEVRVENADINDVEVDVEIVLYNEDEDDEVVEISLDDKDIDAGEKEDFSFNIDLSYNLDEGDDYILYAEVYVNGVTYRKEIDIDLDRKDHDIVIDNTQVFTIGDDVDISVDISNRGGKAESDVYIELKVYELGLNLASDKFELGKWDDSNNRMVKKFRFDKPEKGVYTLEANVYYGAYSVYTTKSFEIKDTPVLSENKQSNIQFLEGQQFTGQAEEKHEWFTMENVTWGIADFLLLVVVIYLFVWLI